MLNGQNDRFSSYSWQCNYLVFFVKVFQSRSYACQKCHRFKSNLITHFAFKHSTNNDLLTLYYLYLLDIFTLIFEFNCHVSVKIIFSRGQTLNIWHLFYLMFMFMFMFIYLMSSFTI